VAELIASKRRWIGELPPRGQRLARHREICRVNESLQACVAGKRRDLLQRREELIEDVRRQEVLGSREYAFCLFESVALRAWLLDTVAESF